jgi:hypothetical protein
VPFSRQQWQSTSYRGIKGALEVGSCLAGWSAFEVPVDHMTPFCFASRGFPRLVGAGDV